MSQSFKTEVCVSGTWATNALRFATKAEAEAAGEELLSRWFAPTDSRAAESEDAVTHRFDFFNYKAVPLVEGVKS